MGPLPRERPNRVRAERLAKKYQCSVVQAQAMIDNVTARDSAPSRDGLDNVDDVDMEPVDV